jgi:HAMP domain-containing protein
MKKWKRRKYLINKSLQPRFMGMTALFVFLFSVISGWCIYSATWITITERIHGEPELYQILAELNETLLLRSLFVVLAGMCAVVIIMMFISHRIAGPLFRVRRILNELGEGIIPGKITFRKKDEFKELSEAVNSVIIRAEEMDAANKEVRKNILKYAGEIPGVEEELDRMRFFEKKNM